MASLEDKIHKARLENFTDDEIYDYLKTTDDFKKKMSIAESEGFTEDEIKKSVFPQKRIGKNESIAVGATEVVLLPAVGSQLLGQKFLPSQPENLPLQRDLDEKTLDKPLNQMSLADIHSLGDDVVAPGDYFGPKQSQREDLQKSGVGLTPIDALLALPESKDPESRKARSASTGGTLGGMFGPLGFISGVAGGYAGQAVREQIGKDGKTENWWQEGLAIATDLVTGLGTNILGSFAKNTTKSAVKQGMKTVFSQVDTPLERSLVKNTVQDSVALEKQIASIGEQELETFNNNIAKIAPETIEALPTTELEPLKDQVLTSWKEANLNAISPVEATAEEGGRAVQEATKQVYNANVIKAEKAAYDAGKAAAKGLSGEAPEALSQAKKLLNDLVRVTPNPDQDPVIRYLRGLIGDLETTTAEKIIGPSALLDQFGNPAIPGSIIPATTKATKVPANDLITLVQNGNHSINYDSTLREQSHRLKPIIATLREETGKVLSKKAEAKSLYDSANKLHGSNAEIWNTKYMKNVLYSENPEVIISQSKKASNMRNFKEAVPLQNQQALVERLVIEDITSSGSSSSNAKSVKELGNTLSPNSQEAAKNIITVKNPATRPGGVNAAANSIVKEVSESVVNGTIPTQTLNTMKTVKGYQFVKRALARTSEGRQIFKTLEKKIVQDLLDNILDKSGKIDFKKAQEVFKNSEMKTVINEIGGPQMVSQIKRLETLSVNLQRNLDFFKKPATQSLFKSFFKSAGKAGMVGYLLRALHMPSPVIFGLGLSVLAGKGTIAASKVAWRKMIQNPRIYSALESVSRSTTEASLKKQLPRLILEIEKEEKEEKDKK